MTALRRPATRTDQRCSAGGCALTGGDDTPPCGSARENTYTYDELGRVKSRTLAGTTHASTYAYDSLGRLATQTTHFGTFIYEYVGVTGRLSRLTYPSGQRTDYAYQPVAADSYLQEIRHLGPSRGSQGTLSQPAGRGTWSGPITAILRETGELFSDGDQNTVMFRKDIKVLYLLTPSGYMKSYTKWGGVEQLGRLQ